MFMRETDRCIRLGENAIQTRKSEKIGIKSGNKCLMLLRMVECVFHRGRCCYYYYHYCCCC